VSQPFAAGSVVPSWKPVRAPRRFQRGTVPMEEKPQADFLCPMCEFLCCPEAAVQCDRCGLWYCDECVFPWALDDKKRTPITSCEGGGAKGIKQVQIVAN